MRIINNKEIIIESQKYIEKHLEEKLQVRDIANIFDYSEFHFSRMFSEYVGISVMEYVKRRRLIRAAELIVQGSKIIDAAVQFSYDSHSGFTKAFKKEFGYSPSLLNVFAMQINELKGGNKMSKLFIRETNEHECTEKLYEYLIECIKNNSISCDLNRIENAYGISKKAYKGIQRYSGDEYITHPLNVAIILAEIEADENLIIAGLMCDILKRTDLDIKDLKENFSDVIDIVIGLSDVDISQQNDREDIVLVKLAERLHNMRTLRFMDEGKWRVKAQETIEKYMPIARKLGNSALTEELNKIALEFM